MKDEIRRQTRSKIVGIAGPKRKGKTVRSAFFILHPSSFILSPSFILTLLLSLSMFLAQSPYARAQSRQGRRNEAHSKPALETFTPAHHALVERAIAAACLERQRDPFGSAPIDEMQARPSLPVGHPDAVAGARRAERLLPEAKRLVVTSLIQLSHEYRIYENSQRIRIATARVQQVTRVKPDMEARDNASVFLKDPHTIHFGTIFLAGLRSDESVLSVLAHELTHIADGQSDTLHALFRAIGKRAASRTDLHIEGQRAEELSCDLVGAMATRSFIQRTPSWEPLSRRLARALEHNCVAEDEGDEEHLSPRNTIRALFTLDLSLANNLLSSKF